MQIKTLLLSSVFSLNSFSSIAQAQTDLNIQPQIADTVCAQLFMDINYGGDSLIAWGKDTSNQWIGRYFNDETSSVLVSPGCSITLYQDWNFGGKSLTLYGNTSWIGSEFNDETSSYKCSCN
ncbi:peptidase inhibitor family I36 protein [Fluviispira sanaruensis]|uniref:Beta/gamma crystallin 'Greek key' domain-containing protein n=1 Tax=Fluviispira sanaruensis TaxID=2493639 RepID=A0A4V0P2F7_FLUSA|nr:peptidase inhibitor family I36 protein [Fluviispira sanaruensis]BBH53067.1 hypothetical protein JCM31447_15100 [Fluviispira sanaruensis]